MTETYDRISMHGVRRVLLEAQAASLGLPLEQVLIGAPCSNEEYEAKMRAVLARYQAEGVDAVVVGDIFLEDLRKYREDNLAKLDLKAVFPIWKRDTAEMAREFIRLGFKTIITCVDGEALDGAFVGREYDEAFLADLPAGVDPCGENGEFHSFVYDGPIFARPIPVKRGEIVLRDNRVHYCDLLPA